ncbi:serine/threonine-protein kinase [Streptomyces sp. SPB074]|uniref:serine/threonine-protein kinase n=1 Tax=Streptomyces sp. (strain SPB074) TaxID=465543 RepID=UPI0001D1E11D|nr:serine/threonine-protein kinase [Streptomyces sp. SPB074]EFG64765.1 serine/threonine-protein kinase PkaA [Streptomyces sp. SPB074]
MRPVGSKYLLEEPLGRGATGTVWRARQTVPAGAEAAVQGQPGETVAIKVLKEELASDPDIVMRFLRERSVLLRLTHPNIVRVRDLVVEGDLLALVMDLVDGPDLHRYLRENGPFSPVAASLLTAQIADALVASHADGVVHRDLKPANVLLREDPEGGLHPLLTDFGIARLADSPGLTRTQEFVGTPAYVAPEAAEGRPQTSAVDIYGAGILLYELLTGRPPFQGESALEVLHRHLSEEPRRPSNVPEPLWTVVARCLGKNPDHRPSAENLARALRVVAEGVGVHANSAQIAAAEGVGALLAPDPDPAPVPEAPPGAAAPTEVLSRDGLPPGAGAYDPAAPTSVLPTTGPGQGAGTGQGGRPGEADPTAVMPPVPPGRQGEEPGAPHPWENQLRAARDRNEQTQIQYLDPDDDPLRRRPHRQQGPAPYGQAPQPGPYDPPQAQRPPYRQGGYQQGQQGGYQQPYQQQPPQAPQPQQYAPPPAPRRQAPPPAEAPPRREPRPPREPRRRSANPMRIPGLGCLKGCLFTLVILFVVGWIVWEVSPLQDWIGTGKGYWDQLGSWIKEVSGWFSKLNG